MNIRELDKLINQLSVDPIGNAELLEFYRTARKKLMYRICDEINLKLKL